MYIYLWSYIFIKLYKIIALSFLNTLPVIVMIVYCENIQPHIPLGHRGNWESKRVSMASSLFLIPHVGMSSWAYRGEAHRNADRTWGCDQELELWLCINQDHNTSGWHWQRSTEGQFDSFFEIYRSLFTASSFYFLFLQPTYWILPCRIRPTIQIDSMLF